MRYLPIPCSPRFSFPAGTTVKAFLEHDNQKRGTLCVQDVQDKSLPAERPTNKALPTPSWIAARDVPLVCANNYVRYKTRTWHPTLA